MSIERKTVQRLTHKQWAEIRSRFEAGEPVTKLASAYDVTRSGISKRAKKEGWLERGALREQAVEEAQAEVKGAIASDYKRQALKANANHLQIYRALQVIGARILKKIENNLIEPDPAKRDRISIEVAALAGLTTAVKSAIEGERGIMQIDKLQLFAKEEDGFDRLCAMIAESRK